MSERERVQSAYHTSRARKNASTTVFFVTTDDLTKPRARARDGRPDRSAEYPLMTQRPIYTDRFALWVLQECAGARSGSQPFHTELLMTANQPNATTGATNTQEIL